ncbi:MAG: leucine-rich repeat domain-containing protein [Oscillospiraceae bacterium]|nr:leucine-rich repeat domain-containing protein [Oscillospiraceae bacterium]
MSRKKTFTKKDVEKLSLSDNHMIIPEGYTKIKYHSGSINLKDIISLTIPASIEEIEPHAFGYLYELKNIYVDKNNSSFKTVDGILFSKDGRRLIKCPPKLDILSYTLPNSVTTIESGAFYYCEALENISLTDNLTKIGGSAFYMCEALKKIDIPESVRKIENLAVCSCTNLTSITLHENLNITGKVFLHCHSLENFTVVKNNGRSKHICAIDGVLFNKDKTVLIDYPIGNKRSSYTIPDGVLEIMPGTFEDAFNLVEIIIPESVKRIGHNAFNNCCKLEHINIPDDITVIEHFTFYSCQALKNITIPRGVICIGNRAFSACDSLSKIVLPDTVTTIESGAFSCCFGLTDITIPESVTEIERRIISSMNPFTVHCKEGSEMHRYAMDNGMKFEFIQNEE